MDEQKQNTTEQTSDAQASDAVASSQQDQQPEQADNASSEEKVRLEQDTSEQAPPETSQPDAAQLETAQQDPQPPNTQSSTPPGDTPPPTLPITQATPASKSRGFPLVILLIMLFVGFLVVAAWYFQAQLQKSTSQTASSAPSPTNTLPKQIIVGTDPTFQPMEYVDKGKMVGYDIDLTNLLAKQLNVKVTFKNITFDNLFPALKQHQIDMIISAVTITDERKKQYTFSEAYLNAGQVIITQKTNTTIKSPKELMGKKIGVQQGTTDEQEALKYTTKPLVIEYTDFEKATAGLVAGNVDAIITDLPSAQGIVSSNSTLKISSDPFTNDYYGIVLRKGDPNVQAVNKALDQLRKRGFLTELKYKWLD